MPTSRSLIVRAGVALGVGALALGGTATAHASPAASDAAGASAAPGTRGVVPPATAPHQGHVSGVRYGADVTVANPQSVHAFKVLHRDLIARSRGASGSAIDTIHPSDGTSFDASTVGSQATQSVSTKIKPARGDTTLYTPTMYPSGGSTPGSCIEMSTAYFASSQVVAAWDWCKAITFVAEIPIDKSFIKTYTKHHNYTTQIVQTKASDNTWTSYLYNYKSGKWETFFTQNGTSELQGVQGWDVYELYSEVDGNGQSYACADLEGRRIEAQGIKVGVGGKLVPATSDNAGNAYDHADSDFYCDSFSYDMIKPFSHWRAVG